MTQTTSLPLPPEGIITPERSAQIVFTMLKKKLKQRLTGDFHEMKDDVRKELGYSEEEAKAMMGYVMKLSGMACQEIFEELEQRYSR